MSRPIELRIHRSAMRANLQRIRQLSLGASVWAVIKARGYGHGLDGVVDGFAQADGLAVLDIEEAVFLRSRGWTKPVLLLEGAFDHADLEEAHRLGLDMVVHTHEQINRLFARYERSESAGTLGRVWIKLNTGMNRLGFPSASLPWLADRVEQMRRLLPAGLGMMTHFASAEDAEGVHLPLRLFKAMTTRLDRHPDEPLSVANSAAAFRHSDARMGWLRPGLALYGASPLPDRSSQQLGLSGAASLCSRLISIQSLEAGDAVGYGGRFVAKRSMRIGVVAAGYADGVMRGAPDGTPVWVSGHLCPLVGQVSMDMLTVDLSRHPSAEVGAEVELWGQALPIDHVARHCGTSAYELMTGVTERVPRRLSDG